VLSEGLVDAHVALVIHEPEGDFGDAGGPFFDLDAVELIDVDAREAVDFVEGHVLLALVDLFEEIEFEETELAVGDDEEVAAAACGIEEL